MIALGTVVDRRHRGRRLPSHGNAAAARRSSNLARGHRFFFQRRWVHPAPERHCLLTSALHQGDLTRSCSVSRVRILAAKWTALHPNKAHPRATEIIRIISTMHRTMHTAMARRSVARHN